MRRRLVTIVIVAIALIATAMMPATAKPTDKRVGVHVNLFEDLFPLPPPTLELDADTAFFVSHGWGLVPKSDGPVGAYDFRLDIDGVDQGKGKKITTGVGYEDPFFFMVKGEMARFRLFNFPDGLEADTYTFTGHWFAPCRVAVDVYMYPGPCPSPNASVEVLTIPRTVIVS